jgi:3-keto-5-aminohexanoate cleavage enzyme
VAHGFQSALSGSQFYQAPGFAGGLVTIATAITGSRPTKEMNTAVPYTPQEITESAVDCWRAGAAIAHIHVRDPETGRPEFKVELFREILVRIREQCNMIVNLNTSGLD